MRGIRLLVTMALGTTACGPEPDVAAPVNGTSLRSASTASELPREWTTVDRATPELEGRYGPHDWTLCRGTTPCTALTWAPVDTGTDRPELTLLLTSNRVWKMPGKERWRRKWRWVDPLLGACLGDALNLDLTPPGVTRTLVEHEDGFWWTFAFDGMGPCDIRGGIELSATHEAGRSTRLTAAGHRWGSPAAVGYASDVLQQTYGGPTGPN